VPRKTLHAHVVEMPGRPQNITQIVEQVVVGENDSYTYGDLFLEVNEQFACLKWLATRKLIQNSVFCTGCGNFKSLSRYSQGIDGCRQRQCGGKQFSHRTLSLLCSH
jgi:coenzyme F420-reducing hydrogenase gamma subunit